jgi:hypothetical protein
MRGIFTMMSKPNSILFVVVAAILNLVGYVFLLARYIGCNDQLGCIGPGTTITGYILGFPLNVLSWLWQKPGQPMSHWAFVLAILNAVLFGCVLRFVLNMFFKKRGDVS